MKVYGNERVKQYFAAKRNRRRRWGGNPDYYNDNISSFTELNNYPLILQKEESNSRKLLDHIALEKNVRLIYDDVVKRHYN